MKKFIKFVMGVAALAGTVCGVLYFLQKVLGWDIFKKDEDDDYDTDDFDNGYDDISDDEEQDDREYVTLDLEKENENKDDTQEVKEQADEAQAEGAAE